MLRRVIILLAIVSTVGFANRAEAYDSTLRKGAALQTIERIADIEQANKLVSICRANIHRDTLYAYAQQLEQLAISIGSSEHLSHAYEFLGWYHYCCFNFDSATTYYFKSIQINDSIGSAVNIALGYNSVGECFHKLFDYGAAYNYYNRAIKILQENDSQSVAMAYVLRNMGCLYNDFGVYETSKIMLQQALQIDLEYNNLEYVVSDYVNLALVENGMYERQKHKENISAAKQYSDSAMIWAAKLNSGFFYYHTLYSKMEVELNYAFTLPPNERRQMLDSCLFFYDFIVDMAKQFGFYSNIYYALTMWKAKYFVQTKQYNDAIVSLSTIDKSEKISPFVMAGICNLYVTCYESLGNYRKAIEYKQKLRMVRKSNIDNGFQVDAAQKSIREDFDAQMLQHKISEQRKAMIYEEQRKHSQAMSQIIGVAFIMLVLFVIFILREQKQRQATNVLLLKHQKELTAQRNKLSKANHEQTSSIRYAKDIQTLIMPSCEILTQLFPDNMVIWKPLQIVSGDFYWVAQVGRFKVVAVADCTGHGVPGALMSMLGLTTLNNIAANVKSGKVKERNVTAAFFLNSLCQRIADTMHERHTNDDRFDGMHIAICLIDTDKNELQYSGAFRPISLATANGIELIQPDKTPVGFYTHRNYLFSNNIIKIHKGDVVYLYTDGITNQLSNADRGNKFSVARLNKLLFSVKDLPFDVQQKAVDEALMQWRKSSLGQVCEQTDDQILIGIRI